MKRFTRAALLFVLVLALLVPMSASAQEMPCYGLSSADCELYYKPNTTMEGVSSFTLNYTFNLNVPDTVELNSDGGGNFSEVPGAADPLKSFNLDMVINGSGNDMTTGETQSMSFEFRIIDGMFYLNTEGLADFEGIEGLQGWIGFMLEPLITAIMESGGLADMGLDLEGLLSGEAAEMPDVSGMDMAPFADLFTKYVTATRGADIDVAGNAVAPFTVSFDLAGLLADPGLTEAMNALTTSLSGMAGEEMSEEDLQSMQMMVAMIPMLGMMFSDTAISVTQNVGVNDGYLYGFGFNLDMTLDPAMMAGFTGESDDASAEPVTIVLNFFVELTNHNQSFTFTAPETFTDMTEQIQAGMSGGF